MILDNKLNNLLDIDQLTKNDILYIFEFAEKTGIELIDMSQFQSIINIRYSERFLIPCNDS